MLTVTAVVEHAFCHNFTYFEFVLGLNQYQGKRGTVASGRAVHKRYETTNTNYVPAGFDGRKIVARTYHSHKLGLIGRIDEAVEMKDEVVLIERKHTNYTQMKDTLRVQLGLLAMLVEESTVKPVRRALVVFTKDERVTREFAVDDGMRKFALRMLESTRETIRREALPEAEFDNRCLNCCFRRVCPVGSLNTE